MQSYTGHAVTLYGALKRVLEGIKIGTVLATRACVPYTVAILSQLHVLADKSAFK